MTFSKPITLEDLKSWLSYSFVEIDAAPRAYLRFPLTYDAAGNPIAVYDMRFRCLSATYTGRSPKKLITVLYEKFAALKTTLEYTQEEHQDNTDRPLLFWRNRPELRGNGESWEIYCRLAFWDTRLNERLDNSVLLKRDGDRSKEIA